MTALKHFEIAVKNNVIQQQPDGWWLLTMTGVSFPDTPEGRENAGVAEALACGEDVTEE